MEEYDQKLYEILRMEKLPTKEYLTKLSSEGWGLSHVRTTGETIFVFLELPCIKHDVVVQIFEYEILETNSATGRDELKKYLSEGWKEVCSIHIKSKKYTFIRRPENTQQRFIGRLMKLERLEEQKRFNGE